MVILRWQRAHEGWSFWLRWLAGTIAGLEVVIFLTTPLNAALAYLTGGANAGSPHVVLATVSMFIWWAFLGAGLGLGQWWAVRSEIQGAGWWVLATIAGYPLGFLVPGSLPPMDSPLLGGLVMMGSFGLALGVLQWLGLRGRVHQAGWWVLISLAGWWLAVGATGAAYLSGLYVEPFDMLAAFLFPTAVGGVGMAWLLAHKIERVPQPVA